MGPMPEIPFSSHICVMQADAAGDANAQIAALERLHAALLARDEVAGRLASLDQARNMSPGGVAPVQTGATPC